MDFDARVLHPELFSNLASRLDQAVANTAVKVVGVTDMNEAAWACLRLSAARGGCDLTPAKVKGMFAHLAAACHSLPRVAQRLLDQGWSREQVDSTLDLSGIEQCLAALRAESIFVAFDGTVTEGVCPTQLLVPQQIAWCQARLLIRKTRQMHSQSKSRQMRRTGIVYRQIGIDLFRQRRNRKKL